MVVLEGGEPAIAVTGIMNWGLDRRLQSIVAAIAVDAGVPGKFFRVAAQAELVIRLIEVARREHQFALAIALEAATRNYVKDAVSTVTQSGSIAPPVDLQVVDILGIDLRRDIA